MVQLGDNLLTYWYLFCILLNTGLMIYLPYTFFFYQALPPLKNGQIITSAFFVVLQIAEIMVKLQTQTFSQKKQQDKDISKRLYMHKGVFLDVLGLISIISTFINTPTATPFRLLIYCKIPSVGYYDNYVHTHIKSSIFEFLYTIMDIMFIYLTFCNLTAGGFFKLDYHIYQSEGFYFQNGMQWLVSAASMPNIINWDYTIHYLYAMYWSIITACTIGYGDITPLNPYEVVLVCIIFVPNILFYGYLIDNINLNFSKIDELDELVIQNQLAILKTLSDVKAGFSDVKFFKYHIKKTLEMQLDQKAVVYDPLSKNLKMQLNYQIFKKPLNKFGDLSLQDSNILCNLIQQHIYQPTEVIYPGNKFIYIAQGKGKIVLRGLDVCSHQSSNSIASSYREYQSLNMCNYLSQHQNPWVHYIAGQRTRIYWVKEWVNTSSMRQKRRQVLINNNFAKYGIECDICNYTHPITQCYYLTFNQHNIKENLQQHQKNKINKMPKSNPYNGRTMYRRHDRQNQAVIQETPYQIIKFQESYIKGEYFFGNAANNQ